MYFHFNVEKFKIEKKAQIRELQKSKNLRIENLKNRKLKKFTFFKNFFCSF